MKKFVYCASTETEVPIENNDGCCEFYNETSHKCEYKKYSHRSSIKRLSEREEIYRAFSSREDSDFEDQ